MEGAARGRADRAHREEASAYWLDVLDAGRLLERHFEPVKMNYDTLGNALPHLHTHLVPRFADDPRPGEPFPFPDQPWPRQNEEAFRVEVEALRRIVTALRTSPDATVVS